MTTRGRLLDLPSCAAGATGALVSTKTFGRRVATVGPAKILGEVSRLLRVTDTRACVERTFFPTSTSGLSAHLVVVGLATDYCVKNSVLGARRAGLEVTVLTDGIRGVNLEPGDSAQALDDMAHAGAVLATLDAFDGAPE